MAIKLKEFKIKPYEGEILTRHGHLRVGDLFDKLKHKSTQRVVHGKIKGVSVLFTNFNIYYLNYKTNNNVCKCGICGAKATHVSLVTLKHNNKKSFRFFTIKDKKEMIFNIDHIIPVSKGGSNDIDNLQITCKDCNSLKSNKLPNEITDFVESIKPFLINNVSNKTKENIVPRISVLNNVPGPKHITNNVDKPNYKNNIVFKQCYKINNVGLDVTWTSTMFANNV